MNSKGLHKHTLPVIVACLGLLVVSTVSFQRFTLNTPARTNLIGLMTAHSFSLKPAANGLFHISRYQPASQASSVVPPAGSQSSDSSSTAGLAVVTTTGQVAALNAVLGQSALPTSPLIIP